MLLWIKNVCCFAPQIPEEADRARPWNPKAAMLLTGLTSASGLKDHMYPVFDSEKGLASVELAGAFASEGSEVMMVFLLENASFICR